MSITVSESTASRMDVESPAAVALRGLTATPKTLPSELLYDEAGSEIFEKITEDLAYYVTRTELALLEQAAADIVALLPFAPEHPAALVEFGASSDTKALNLLEAPANRFSTYVAIDISPAVLHALHARMARSHPQLAVKILEANFMQPIKLPAILTTMPVLAFFPGSTIGNMLPSTATEFLANVRGMFSGAGRPAFLIGCDMCQDAKRLRAAYNPSDDAPRALGKNLLRHVKSLLQGTFDPEAFALSSYWNELEYRMEFSLVSQRIHDVEVAGQRIYLEKGEPIGIGLSYKYLPEQFLRIAGAAGWTLAKFWHDAEKFFGLYLLLGSEKV